jgi:hypothetical protein
MRKKKKKKKILVTVKGKKSNGNWGKQESMGRLRSTGRHCVVGWRGLGVSMSHGVVWEYG